MPRRTDLKSVLIIGAGPIVIGQGCEFDYSGARTIKMKFGHHGANHPVLEVASGRVMISSQNHGFAVDEASLPPNLRVTHRSLFDGSVQGLERTDVPAFCFQGHPEASPGPHDILPLFDRFTKMMAAAQAARAQPAEKISVAT